MHTSILLLSMESQEKLLSKEKQIAGYNEWRHYMVDFYGSWVEEQ